MNTGTKIFTTTISMEMTVSVSNQIRITNPPPTLTAAITQALSLKNPSYHQALKRNPRLRYSPLFKEYIPYYRREGSDLVIPRGCFARLDHFLQSQNMPANVEFDLAYVPADLKTHGLTLRDYQKGVPEACLGHQTGIFRLDTGFGKTIIALKVAELLGQKTLIIVPKLDLLNLFVYEIEKYCGKQPGIIQGDKFDIKDITVATVQTLRKRIDQDLLPRGSFGAILCDEAHLFVPDKTRRVLEYFRPAYLFGFTATARRTDGQGEAIKFIFGDIICDRKVERATPTVELVDFIGHIPMLEYAEMIEYQTLMRERNELITLLATREIQKGRRVLILTKRVKHYEIIHEKLEGLSGSKGFVHAGIHRFDSTMEKKERDDLLQSLRSGSRNFSCLLGTFSLLSTGIDVPALDTLIIAGDLKSDVLAEQSAGRILRLFEGKANPKIIDIQDKNNPILKNQARARVAFYYHEDWAVNQYGTEE